MSHIKVDKMGSDQYFTNNTFSSISPINTFSLKGEGWSFPGEVERYEKLSKKNGVINFFVWAFKIFINLY